MSETVGTTLFVVGNTDYSDYVNRRKYKVNSTDEVTTWTDANHVKHGDLIRSEISGTIILLFIGVTDYNAFVTAMDNAKGTDGKYPIQVYVNNTHTLAEINAFISFSVDTVFANKAYDQAPMVFEVTLRLEEE